MERNYRSAAPLSGCENELRRSDLEDLALTAENCQGALLRFENSTLEGCTLWTNEKHNLYLNNLEMLFVKQLHESTGLLVRCSEQNGIHESTSQKQQNNIHTGYGQDITDERDECISHIPADLQKPLTHGLAAHAEQLSSSALYEGDQSDLMREGMGQNFVNEVTLSNSNNKSQAKRSKTADTDNA